MAAADPPAPVAPASPAPSATGAPGDLAVTGRHLFLQNCAHCHGIDATGDEGPDLHEVIKSDESITTLIKNGKKGDMPSFGRKLSDADIVALIAYVRSIQE